MIEATQKKLREAKFFFRFLDQAKQPTAMNDPDVFEFYLSAFLSAARSVTFVIQHEEKAKYDEWFKVWSSSLSEEEQHLLAFLKDQRNNVLKQGAAETNMVWEYIPITEMKTDSRGRHGIGLYCCGPPGISAPTVGVPVHFFKLSGSQIEVTSSCKRYLNVLNKFVEDFTRVHKN